MKKCSFCGEEISDAAAVCQWCGRKQQARVAAKSRTPRQREPKRSHYVTKGMLQMALGVALGAMSWWLFKVSGGAWWGQALGIVLLLVGVSSFSSGGLLVAVRQEGGVMVGRYYSVTCPHCGGVKNSYAPIQGELACIFCGKTYHVGIDTR